MSTRPFHRSLASQLEVGVASLKEGRDRTSLGGREVSQLGWRRLTTPKGKVGGCTILGGGRKGGLKVKFEILQIRHHSMTL